MSPAVRQLMTWLACAVFLVSWLYAAAHFDHERAAVEAEQVQAARHSREWVASQVCAQNGGHRWVSDTELQCLNKHGRKSGPVVVAGVGQ